MASSVTLSATCVFMSRQSAWQRRGLKTSPTTSSASNKLPESLKNFQRRKWRWTTQSRRPKRCATSLTSACKTWGTRLRLLTPILSTTCPLGRSRSWRRCLKAVLSPRSARRSRSSKLSRSKTCMQEWWLNLTSLLISRHEFKNFRSQKVR